MMICNIETYHISLEPFGTAKAVHKCTTHDWVVEYPVSPGYLCPIGRIEEARDKAIAAIEEAGRE